MLEFKGHKLSDLKGACLCELKKLKQGLATPSSSISADHEIYRLIHYQDVSEFSHDILQGIYLLFQDSGTYIDSDRSKLKPVLQLVAAM